MADLLGYKSITTYWNIENGKSQPNANTMNEISEILGQPVQNFFDLKIH